MVTTWKIILLLTLFTITTVGYTQSRSKAEEIASMLMKLHADSLVVKPYVTHGPAEEDIEVKLPKGRSSWNYEHAVLLKGFESLWRQTNNPTYLNYMKKMMDKFVLPDGSIRTYDMLEYNIDHVTPGRILLTLYRATQEEKYKKTGAKNQCYHKPEYF